MGIHFSAQNNADLGNALADKVLEIFSRKHGECRQVKLARLCPLLV